MQHIPISSLENLPDRVSYIRSFLAFTEEDAAVLHAAKPVVAPLVPTVVDLVYEKLLNYDITAAAFGNPAELSSDHPNIQFRKDFLRGYLVKLVTMDYSKDGAWEYLDLVGSMHTGPNGATLKHRANGKRPSVRVEYVHCGLLLGYVEDILANAVMMHKDLDLETKTKVIRAVNKLLWVQNDLFARHYLREGREAPSSILDAPKVQLATVAAVLVAAGAGLTSWLSN